MSPLIRTLAVAVAVVFAAPSFAQTFEGLDLSEPRKKKRPARKKPAEKKPAEKKPEADDLPMPPPPPGTTQRPSSAAPAQEEDSGGLGLDLTQPEPPKQETKTAPTMSFDAVDVSGKTADRQRLDIANGQFKSKKYELAALTAFELLQDPKMAELASESQYVLAKSLYRMGLYHSSLDQFSKILARGPSQRFFKNSLEWLFFISHKTTNETVILDEIAKYANHEFPEKFRNEFRYLLARYHFVRGRALDLAEQRGEGAESFEQVRRIALMIPRGDKFYPRARYLEALAHFRDEKFQQAVDSLKEVVRLTRPGTAPDAATAEVNEALREMAFMQLARTHYGHRQNRYAITYYGKVERGSAQWLQALFEASWAHYRIGQYEQALGNLITLSSPFFRDEYFPEALILKSVIYYENCRYRESTMIIEDFERLYQPVIRELEKITAREGDPSEYYNVLAEVQKKARAGGTRSSTDVILERILKLALTDQDLKKVNDSILELEAELDGYGSKADTFKYSELSKTLMESLKQQRAELIAKAGRMAKSKLELELDSLKELLGNALRIRFETINKEKQFLEEMLRAGGETQIVKQYRYSVAVADDELYWPYEGEYWRDELGTYQYTLTKGCVSRDTANVNTSSR